MTFNTLKKFIKNRVSTEKKFFHFTNLFFFTRVSL